MAANPEAGGDANLVGDVRTVCDIVNSTLGPFGANKLVVTEDGTVTATSDGAQVVERLDVDSPALSMLASAATGFRDEHGDGASTVVALAGALLAEAADLRDRGCHPTAVERGYRHAATVALDDLERRARPLSDFGAAAVARSALTGTRHPTARETVADTLAHVVEVVDAEGGDDATVGRDVKVLARIGAVETGTELLRGLLLDLDPVSPAMPRTVEDAGVAVLTSTVDLPALAGERSKSDVRDATMTVESLDEREAFRERELESFRHDLQAALDAGCGVVVTERAVNDRVETLLANRGVLAVDKVDHADVGRLARATGATAVPSLGDVTPETLGHGNVGVRRYAGRDMIAVEADGHPVFTLLCRAPDPRSVETFRRSVEAALHATDAAQRDDAVVPGGGAAEVGAARAVRERAPGVEGREQLAVEAFADALGAVPRALARNGGLDGWGALSRLNAAHSEGRDAVGVDSLLGEVRDVLDADEGPIVDPLSIKREAVNAATDLAVRFVRIDDRLPASDLGGDEGDGDEGDGDGGPDRH